MKKVIFTEKAPAAIGPYSQAIEANGMVFLSGQLPVFSINLGVGRNVVCKGADTDSFYQVVALKTDITRNLFLHVGYQLYKFKDPNNLMLGLGFRFNAKR